VTRGLTRLLAGQPGGGQVAQLIADEGEKIGRGAAVPGGGRVLQGSHVRHVGQDTAVGGESRVQKGEPPVLTVGGSPSNQTFNNRHASS